MSNNSHKQNTKRRKIHGQHNETEVEQSAQIFKLPVEIFENIFDHLSKFDFLSISKTCKWMQRVAAHCFQQNYSGVFLQPSVMEHGIVYMKDTSYHDHLALRLDEGFFQIFDKITVVEMEEFKAFCLEPWEFHQLKTLKICKVNFKKPYKFRLKRTRQVLSRLEDLRIQWFKMPRDSLENLISLMPNIKRLQLLNMLHSEIDCFTRTKYPMLNRCTITSEEPVPIVKFLELNPNINSFGMNSDHIYYLPRFSKIKLDILAIYYRTWYLKISKLNDLYRIGLYSRLELYIKLKSSKEKIDQNRIDDISKLNALTKLYLSSDSYFSEPIQLSALKHLEEISIPDSEFIVDLETLATNFKNLERIHFGRSNLDHLMLFTSRNSKLNKIKVSWFMKANGNIERHQIIRLSAMNRERAKLANANKITIYVREEVYLVTKRAERDTDLEFIRLKRHESYEWDNDFDIGEDYLHHYYRGSRIAWDYYNGQRTSKSINYLG